MSDFANALAKVGTLQARLAALAAPLNVTLPYVGAPGGAGGVGVSLICSTGTWDHAPASYAYQWKSAAVNVGTNSPTYTPVAGDAAKNITCVVTATNAFGSTPGTSNAVAVN
jgi:hypothetical protein